jgi:anti-sigma factor RsiW
MNDRHLSDDQLIDLCVSGTTPAGHDGAHLAVCPACAARRASIIEILSELDAAADASTDAAFPPDRLERQQARILQRVDQDGRPGRLISFPAHQGPATLLRSRPRVRWTAAAAVAAFVFGLLAGHFAHDLSDGNEPQSAGVVGNGNPTPLRAVSTTFSEDEFLGEVEVAATQTGPVALRPLDAMTPRAWDVK